MVSVLLVSAGFAAPTDSLESGFLQPPDSAKPQTWWHWMNGNVTKTGITADLEAMKQIGLGGATIVNVSEGIPHGDAPFMSAAWRDDFKFAIQEANRLGLEMCVENCAGWSSSGGPWNTVTNSMKRVTTSEIRISGPTNFSGTLPQPQTALNFYRDVAVLAFPATDNPATIKNLAAKDGQNGRAVLSDRNAGNSTAGAIQRRDILDLKAKLSADGRLNWRAPAGEWIVLRVGYTTTGVKNHPAPPEGEGLECDKFSKSALDEHWNGFMQKVLNDIGPLAGKTLDSSFIDSYEVGGQNWSENFRKEFQKRRGYDPLKFLPAFTGRVVDNPAVSERFLWDVRRTIADLFAENYYGRFAELCRKHGLLNVVEPYTGPFESLQCGAPNDLVMGEFWAGSQGDPSVKLAASVANIYGKTIVGAESFTARPENGRWQNDPYSLKALGDLMYCQGLNRFVFHRYAMQPWTNVWPGMTMGQWGIHFERTETWWNQGKPWIDYLSRCQFLLQQGRPVRDAAYFTGESAPVEMRRNNPPLPAGYDYDAVNADVLRGATVKNGRLTLASGANYAVLVLSPEDSDLTPATLRRITELVRAGATVVGPRPQHSPSLENYPKCDTQVRRIAGELWDKCDGKTVLEHNYGKGRVVWGKSLADVFAEQRLKPDFEFQGASADTDLAYTHRVDDDADIYFVSNQRRQFDSADCTFRVSGKAPELWHPDTGVIEPAPIWSAQGERTRVWLSFEPAGSVFVIFRYKSEGADHIVAVKRIGPGVAKAKPAELRILKAVYGPVPSRSDSRLDVTAKIKALVRRGTRQIPADNEMAGQDPAEGIVKRLRVEFLLNGERRTNQVGEGETLEIPAGAEVIQAVYGDVRSETASADSTVDLTKKLNDMAKIGEVDIDVNNEFAGRDPLFGIPKELHVDYTLNGQPGHATVPENETLTLSAMASVGQVPQWETSIGADGAPIVKMRENGVIDFQTANGKHFHAEAADVPAPQPIVGEWNLSFPPNWGAPPSVVLDKLISWTDHTNSGVRYFSGTATYEKEIEIPAARLAAGRELWLDLGVVKNFAEVSLNGNDFGVLWKPPFRVNLTAAAKPGLNKLVIKVTNLWPNRLIGDEQLPDDREWNGKQLKAWPQWFLDGKPSPTGRLTFTTWHHWTKDSPLLESGLLGPVELETVEIVSVAPSP